MTRSAPIQTPLFAAVLAVAVTSAAAAPQTGSAAKRDAVLARTTELFAAAETGDANAFRAILDEQWTGQSLAHDNLVQLLAAERQVRFHLTDTSAAVSSGTAVIKTLWERRSVAPGSSSPLRRAGTVSLMFVMTGGVWRLAGVGGDDPFARAPQKTSPR